METTEKEAAAPGPKKRQHGTKTKKSAANEDWQGTRSVEVE